MSRRFDPITVLFLAFLIWSSVRSGQFSDPREWLMRELMMLPGIVIGLAFHEFGHAFVSDKLGDPTPRMQGRVTINPLAHIDLIGFVSLLFLGFGWGRPVEIDPRYYKHRRRDELLVSLAGVVMNLIMAVIFGLILRAYAAAVGYDTYSGMHLYIYTILYLVVYINLVLMVFNILPIPPLDGFNIITDIFDLRRYRWWYKLYENGFIILILLIVFNYTDRILTPCVQFFINIIL
ncbi:MAG: site-2 protease family protein [Anaerovoracaceae bacterium]